MKKFFKLLFVFLSLGINFLLHLVKVIRYENTATLAPSLRFGNEEHCRRLFSLFFGDLTRRKPFFSLFHTFGVVLRDLVHLLWIQPRLWEEGVLVGELLLKALQMDGQRVLASNVVHSQEVVHPLVGLELRQELRGDSEVLPADLPVHVSGVIGHELLQLLHQLFVFGGELGSRHQRWQVGRSGGVGICCVLPAARLRLVELVVIANSGRRRLVKARYSAIRSRRLCIVLGGRPTCSRLQSSGGSQTCPVDDGQLSRTTLFLLILSNCFSLFKLLLLLLTSLF